MLIKIVFVQGTLKVKVLERLRNGIVKYCEDINTLMKILNSPDRYIQVFDVDFGVMMIVDKTNFYTISSDVFKKILCKKSSYRVLLNGINSTAFIRGTCPMIEDNKINLFSLRNESVEDSYTVSEKYITCEDNEEIFQLMNDSGNFVMIEKQSADVGAKREVVILNKNIIHSVNIV